MFASRNFIVLALIFKAIIFFLLIFVYDLRQEPNLFFGHFDHIIVPAPFVEKIILFSSESTKLEKHSLLITAMVLRGSFNPPEP